MKPANSNIPASILTVNGGSSSIKFAPSARDWTRWSSLEASVKMRHASARASAMDWAASASKLTTSEMRKLRA